MRCRSRRCCWGSRQRSPAPLPSSPTASSRRSSRTPPTSQSRSSYRRRASWRPAPTSWRLAPRAAKLAQLARHLRAGPRPTRDLAHAQPHVVGDGPGPVHVHPVSKKRWRGALVRVRVASREDSSAGMRREAETRAHFKTLDVFIYIYTCLTLYTLVGIPGLSGLRSGGCGCMLCDPGRALHSFGRKGIETTANGCDFASEPN